MIGEALVRMTDDCSDLETHVVLLIQNVPVRGEPAVVFRLWSGTTTGAYDSRAER